MNFPASEKSKQMLTFSLIRLWSKFHRILWIYSLSLYQHISWCGNLFITKFNLIRSLQDYILTYLTYSGVSQNCGKYFSSHQICEYTFVSQKLLSSIPTSRLALILLSANVPRPWCLPILNSQLETFYTFIEMQWKRSLERWSSEIAGCQTITGTSAELTGTTAVFMHKFIVISWCF